MCRVLSHEFWVVRRYRTVSVWCAVCLCTSLGCFKHIEPRRTFPNHIITEIAKCVEFCHEFGVVQPYRTFSVYIVTGETRSAGFLCTSSGWLKHIEPHRIFSNHIITEIERFVEFCHMSSGGFDCTEPSLSISLQGQQGMQGVVHLFGVVQALVDPSRTTSLQR